MGIYSSTALYILSCPILLSFSYKKYCVVRQKLTVIIEEIHFLREYLFIKLKCLDVEDGNAELAQ